MEYRKINDATVQCFISNQDMESQGVSLTDIFERNEKGEHFLRFVIENALTEVGCEMKDCNIAMQITPVKDKGLVITFSSETMAGMESMFDHLKQVMSANGLDFSKFLDTMKKQHGEGKLFPTTGALGEQPQEDLQALPDKKMPLPKIQYVVFDSLNHVIAFCCAVTGESGLGSKLYKCGEKYMLVLEKKKISYDKMYKVLASSFEFGTPVDPDTISMEYIEEHYELMLEKQAISKLRKIGTL